MPFICLAPIKGGCVLLPTFCFRRNWTFPLDRLAYNLEGGNRFGRKVEEFFWRGQGSDSETSSD